MHIQVHKYMHIHFQQKCAAKLITKDSDDIGDIITTSKMMTYPPRSYLLGEIRRGA